MPALRILLGDGREERARSYRLEADQVIVERADGGNITLSLAEVDLGRTFAANAALDFLAAAPVPAPAPGQAPLEVSGLSEAERGEYRVVEGLVRNVSSVELGNLVLHVLGEDEGGSFVTAEEILLGGVIGPGGESPFRVILRSGGRVRRTRLRFHQLLGEEVGHRPAGLSRA